MLRPPTPARPPYYCFLRQVDVVGSADTKPRFNNLFYLSRCKGVALKYFAFVLGILKAEVFCVPGTNVPMHACLGEYLLSRAYATLLQLACECGNTQIRRRTRFFLYPSQWFL